MAAAPPPRVLIVITVMAATLMQVLDMTIVNVALPHMQGSLGANPDQISWTLTSYMVASAIFMPLTGYFTDRLGRKNYMLWSITGFTLASALCGASQSISQIVVFRLLQGVFGASIVPLSQAILADAYPPKDLGKAMAIWGMGVMIGPILGPTLGGYLTEVANWRWIFYINVPVGIATILLAWQVVPNTLKVDRKMDWLGLLLISIAIGATQYFLDCGNQDSWFDAISIRIAALLAIFGLIGFIIYSCCNKGSSVFDVSVFKDRNFTVASIVLFLMGLGLFGTTVLMPLLLENLMNYPALTTGLVLGPRGIAAMIGMIIVAKLVKRISPIWFILVGVSISIVGVYFTRFYSLELSPWQIIWPMMIQGVGMGMIFVPLSVVAYSTIADKLRTEAAGLFSLLRTIGSSVGVAVCLTLFTRHTQISWNNLVGFINPYNPAVAQYFNHIHMISKSPQAMAIVASELGKQAQLLAFLDTFTFIMWSFLAMIPLVFLLRYKKHSAPSASSSVS